MSLLFILCAIIDELHTPAAILLAILFAMAVVLVLFYSGLIIAALVSYIFGWMRDV